MSARSHKYQVPLHSESMSISSTWFKASVSCIWLGVFTSSQAADDPRPRRGDLEEVIVTAQKQAQRLQDVPVPVTAVDTDALVSTNQLRLEDYYAKVPGLSLVLGAPEGAPTLSIRNISMSTDTNPTVATVIDDVSYGSTVTIGNTLPMADIDPGDLERVEVLRGPQGTLYGAASLGGLVKFATLDPSTEELSGRLQAGTTHVAHGDDLGYSFRGAVNLPLSSTFAVRASAFSLQDPGYIDNAQTGERDVNVRDSTGGRLAALWQPTEDWSLRVSALMQEVERQGAAEVHRSPGLSAYEHRQLRDVAAYDRAAQAYGATLRGKLGVVELTSATGYSTDETNSGQDVSPTFFGGQANTRFGVAGAANFFDRTVGKFSQEIRLAAPLGERFEWLLGFFYTREKLNAAADFWAVSPTTYSRVGRLIEIRTPSNRFEERAVFVNLTTHLTDRFDVQIGGRASENELSVFTVRRGPLSAALFGSDPSFVPEASSEDNPITYLVTPRFKISPDLMAYARVASGYRPGIPNVNCGLVPCKSEADTTENYELGFKGSVGEGALNFDASVYYIDWKDIQLSVSQGVLRYVANAGRARSRGVELSIESRPIDGLTLSGWVALSDAELTEDFPSTSLAFGRAGDRLPFGSRTSGSLSIDQEFAFGNTVTMSLGSTVSYVGDRKGAFLGTAARQEYPAYTQVDVRANLSYDTWILSTFVNNVADKRALLGGAPAGFLPFEIVNYNQPRTVGMSLTKSF